MSTSQDNEGVKSLYTCKKDCSRPQANNSGHQSEIGPDNKGSFRFGKDYIQINDSPSQKSQQSGLQPGQTKYALRLPQVFSYERLSLEQRFNNNNTDTYTDTLRHAAPCRRQVCVFSWN